MINQNEYTDVSSLKSKEPDNTVNQIIDCSKSAHLAYSGLSLSQRKKIINCIKEKLIDSVGILAQKELQETQMGKLEDKIIKMLLAIEKTPSVEDLVTDVLTGDDGMTLYEYSSYGIVCAVQPGTNPCATIISNTIGMLAAGNAVIHIPHPRCVEVSTFLTKKINEAIKEVCDIEHLVICLSHSNMVTANELMSHPDTSLVVVTGSQRMVHTALENAKRVIGAGQANPVAIVDETANLEKAAKDIVDGASFDNNIVCLSEKNIVVVSSVMSKFKEELVKNGVYYVDDPLEMLKLSKATLTSDMKMNRALEGKDATLILEEAGISCQKPVKLIVVNTIKKHPFVTEEMLMPLVPLIEVSDFEKALELACYIEQGFRHTALIHSQSITNLNKAARVLQTSLFIKNGSSLEGLGNNASSRGSFTIANVTGEGAVTARDFARKRRCTLTSGFSIR